MSPRVPCAPMSQAGCVCEQLHLADPDTEEGRCSKVVEGVYGTGVRCPSGPAGCFRRGS